MRPLDPYRFSRATHIPVVFIQFLADEQGLRSIPEFGKLLIGVQNTENRVEIPLSRCDQPIDIVDRNRVPYA